MTRTTTPDRYSGDVKDLYRRYQAGRIGAKTFATMISIIWDLRHYEARRHA